MFGFFFTQVTLGPYFFVLAPTIDFILSWGFFRIASVLRPRGKVLCGVSVSPACGGGEGALPTHVPWGKLRLTGAWLSKVFE